MTYPSLYNGLSGKIAYTGDIPGPVLDLIDHMRLDIQGDINAAIKQHEEGAMGAIDYRALAQELAEMLLYHLRDRGERRENAPTEWKMVDKAVAAQLVMP